MLALTNRSLIAPLCTRGGAGWVAMMIQMVVCIVTVYKQKILEVLMANDWESNLCAWVRLVNQAGINLNLTGAERVRDLSRPIASSQTTPRPSVAPSTGSADQSERIYLSSTFVARES